MAILIHFPNRDELSQRVADDRPIVVGVLISGREPISARRTVCQSPLCTNSDRIAAVPCIDAKGQEQKCLASEICAFNARSRPVCYSVTFETHSP
jgi:hypothetical protein